MARKEKHFKQCRHIIKICKDCWDRINHLNLNPLSLAKFFYKKGINDVAIIQRLIYFSYLEVLRAKWTLLFEEKFQAWPGGPVLKSVFETLNENYEELDIFFNKIEDVDKELVLQYLEKINDKYQKLKKIEIYRRSLDSIWKSAREKLENENEMKSIEKENIIPFVHWESNKEKKATSI